MIQGLNLGSSSPGLGRSPEEGKGYSLRYSGLENSNDCIVYGVAKSWTQLSDFHFTNILKEISPEYSFGRTDTEAEAPVLWPPDAKN